MTQELKYTYEGRDVKDGEYALGQLSKPRFGRVCVNGTSTDDLYEDMLVDMDLDTFNDLFKYVKSRDGESITSFTAVVVDNTIIHVY
jgi:hypothetical protein